MPEAKANPHGVDIVQSQVLAGGATFTSEPVDYLAHDVVIVRCTNGNPGPTQPLHVSLELSSDGVAFIAGGRKSFGPVEGESYLQTFSLSEVAAAGAWTEYRLAFGSHVGGDVIIAARTVTAPDPPEPPTGPDGQTAKKKGHDEPKGHQPQPHHEKK